MADTAEAFFDALYGRLVLRDVFGKVVPGFLVLGGLVARLGLTAEVEHALTKAQLGFWIVTVALSWLMALVLQSLGEAIGLIRFWPPTLEASNIRYEQRIAFGRIAKEHESQQAERFMLLSEASGLATCAALVLLACFLSLQIVPLPGHQRPGADADFWAALLVLALAAKALHRFHRSHTQKRYEYMEAVIQHHSSAPRSSVAKSAAAASPGGSIPADPM